jgi:hypothetical protein
MWVPSLVTALLKPSSGMNIHLGMRCLCPDAATQPSTRLLILTSPLHRHFYFYFATHAHIDAVLLIRHGNSAYQPPEPHDGQANGGLVLQRLQTSPPSEAEPAANITSSTQERHPNILTLAEAKTLLSICRVVCWLARLPSGCSPTASGRRVSLSGKSSMPRTICHVLSNAAKASPKEVAPELGAPPTPAKCNMTDRLTP